jgi:hypothetical protein
MELEISTLQKTAQNWRDSNPCNQEESSWYGRGPYTVGKMSCATLSMSSQGLSQWILPVRCSSLKG